MHEGIGAVALDAALGAIFHPVVDRGAFGKRSLNLPCPSNGEVGKGTGGHHQVVEIEGIAATGGRDKESDEAACAIVGCQRDVLGVVDGVGRAGERVDWDEGVEVGAVVHHADNEPHTADIFDAE